MKILFRFLLFSGLLPATAWAQVPRPASTDPAPPAAQQPQEGPGGETFVLDTTLAIVNDQVITLSQIESQAQFWYRSQPDENWKEIGELRRESFALQLVNALFQAGFELYDLDETLVDRIVADEIQNQINDSGSITAFTEELKALGTSLDQHTQAMRNRYMRRLLQERELGLMPAKGRDKFKADIYVKPSDIASYYEEHREDYKLDHRIAARMILLLEKAGEYPAEVRIQELRNEILAGRISFEDAAQQHSAYMPSIRGSMGLVNPEESKDRPEIVAHLKAVSEPGISEPIELPTGWVLIKVEEIRPEGYVPLEEVHLQIATKLEDQHYQYLMYETIKSLRERCYVWGLEVDTILDQYYPLPPGYEDFEDGPLVELPSRKDG